MSRSVKQAVILVGGFGTRLLPLTKTRPKPVMPVLDRPFILYLIESLEDAGVEDIILACGYKSEMISEFIKKSRGAIRADIRYVDEQTPLGTAGAIKNVEHLLDDVFISANGDTLNHVDVTALIKTHYEKRSDVTLSLSELEDPSSSGVVLMNEDSRIVQFQEKPKREEAISNLVNTGLYVMDKKILRYVPEGKFFDISKELFPTLLNNGVKMYGHMTRGTWIDIGKPKDLLLINRAMSRMLDSDRAVQGTVKGSSITGDVYIGKESLIEKTTFKDSVVSSSCIIKSSILDDCLIMSGCNIEAAHIVGSILGEGCIVKQGAIIKNAVLADKSIIEQNQVVGNDLHS